MSYSPAKKNAHRSLVIFQLVQPPAGNVKATRKVLLSLFGVGKVGACIFQLVLALVTVFRKAEQQIVKLRFKCLGEHVSKRSATCFHILFHNQQDLIDDYPDTFRIAFPCDEFHYASWELVIEGVTVDFDSRYRRLEPPLYVLHTHRRNNYLVHYASFHRTVG